MAFRSLDYDYFDRLYARSDDPWRFETSRYEREKYDDTVRHLPFERFGRAFEIGCSVGVLTSMLAARCDSLLAVDINPHALERARRLCPSLPGLRFEQMDVPKDFPADTFDLIVLSEVGYYWSDADLDTARERIARAAPGGIVTLVHFLPKVPEYPRDGDSVHDFFLADPRFRRLRETRAERYRIDVLAVS